MKVWLRTCNECGRTSSYPAPNFDKELTDAYRNKKCKHCKSEGLDYGSWSSPEAEGRDYDEDDEILGL